MVSIQETAELCWLQLNPTPGDETANTKEEFIATAKSTFAYNQLLLAWKEKRDEGSFQVPSYLSTETIPLDVVNNEIDISGFDIMRSLPQEVWLQNIGGINCNCVYIKSTINQSQLLCDDDSLGDNKTYFVIGDKIRFPKGTHSNKLPIIYANNGMQLDGLTMIDDAMASIVRDKLFEIYGGKVAPVDPTNNTNPNQ